MTKNQIKILYNIKKLRELRGYDQKYMAGQLGIQQNTYSKIENGRIKLTVERATKIANILGTNIEVLENFDESQAFQLYHNNREHKALQGAAIQHIFEELIHVFQQITQPNTDRIKILEEKIKAMENALKAATLK